MTEQNQARALLATLRDALQQLEFTLELTRSGVDGVASQPLPLGRRERVGQAGDSGESAQPIERELGQVGRVQRDERLVRVLLHGASLRLGHTHSLARRSN